MTGLPIYDVDIFTDEVIQNPWPHYAAMRDLGPVVWLPRHENFALVHHAVLVQALRDYDTFISGKGVAACAFANEILRGNSAASDGERHNLIRRATSPPLLPGALEKVRGLIEETADSLIEQLIARDGFDAMRDLAAHLPLTIVRDLVGLGDYGKENMLRWASATFDLNGVQNERGKAALEVFMEQRRFAQSQTPEMAKPGSWTHRLLDIVRRGDLPAELMPHAMRDYIVPSLDTTISATGELIYQLGRNPDQWALLRSKPELARNAANEAVRMASPIRSFGRHTSREVQIAGVTIPEGARIMMLFAAANRDERAFDHPNEFDITRDPRLHLGFGRGIHMCAGMHLAQLEMMSILKAMIPHVDTIEVREPTMGINNIIYGFESLPTRFVRRNAAPVRPETQQVQVFKKPGHGLDGRREG
jgi:cytochrome P450